MSTRNAFPEPHPAFSIALVNYKTLPITRICLDLLHDFAKQHSVPVWVVDNGSADDSTQYLRSLDWINLIERTTHAREPGHIAHGKALDLILKRVETPYLFLLHTDTFVFDTEVFSMMMSHGTSHRRIVAVGCLEQINRGRISATWRFVSRLMKFQYRTFMHTIGLPSKEPKPYRETYLKSFCTLWNCNIIKKHNLYFMMDSRVPGYSLQDKVIKLGYTVTSLSSRTIFGYLDHIQAGTVAAAGSYGLNHRRSKIYYKTLQRFEKMAKITTTTDSNGN